MKATPTGDKALIQNASILDNGRVIMKWKRRASVADLSTGPKEPKSTVLSVEEEALIVAIGAKFNVKA